MKKRKHIRHGNMGFTLLELLIVLTIISILATLATPALGEWVENSRAKSTRQKLQVGLAEARNTAIDGSQVVTLCHLLPSGECSIDLGFPISLYEDRNRNAVLDADEHLIRVIDVDIPSNISLKWNHGRFVRFWPSGGAGATTGSLSYCHDWKTGNDFRIVIARTGRTRLDKKVTRC